MSRPPENAFVDYARLRRSTGLRDIRVETVQTWPEACRVGECRPIRSIAPLFNRCAMFDDVLKHSILFTRAFRARKT